MTLPPSTPAVLRDRTRWHLGANAPVVAWLAALLVVTLTRSHVAESAWLMVHLLLLGAVTNAIFVWSSHFADALLRRRATTASRRWQTVRLVILNLGVLTVVAGMVSSAWVLTLAGSVIVGAAAAAQAIALVLQIRTALASRFGATVRYYVFAALFLPIGAGLGAALALDPPQPWRGRLLTAHIITNLLGWVGLTVMGTLVTLWPTMLRTRIAAGAERVARQALPVLAGSVVVAVSGALWGLQAVAAIGVGGYLAGFLWAVRPLAQVARAKAPAAYATWSVMAAVIWLFGSLLGLVVLLAGSPTWLQVSERLGLLVIPLAAGFAAQILLGAMSFLVPVVLGGGPTILRGTQARMDRGNALRATLINAGLVICLLPVPAEVRALVSVLVAGAFAAFLPLLVWAVLYAVRARRVGREPDGLTPVRPAGRAGPPGINGPVNGPANGPATLPKHVPAAAAVARGRHTRQAVLGLALLIVAVAAGYVLAV